MLYKMFTFDSEIGEKYNYLFMDGKWNVYVHECEMECLRQEELLIQRIKEKEGITERLKKDNPME